MERYIYLDNKVIVFIITDPIIEEKIKKNEINPYKIYNITTSSLFTKVTKIYDIHTDKEYKKYGSQHREYILDKPLNNIHYRDRYDYYISIDSIYSHNYEQIYKDKNISGLYKKYNKEGELVEEYYHNNFLKDGEYKRYNYDMLIESTFYTNNIKNGISTIYNTNGLIEKKTNYVNDLKEGDEEEYSYYNNVITYKKIKTYKNNKLIKESSIDDTGKTSIFNYTDGYKNGPYSKTYLVNDIWIEENGFILKGDNIDSVKKIKDLDKIIYEKKTENDTIKIKEYNYIDNYFLKSDTISFKKNNTFKEIQKYYTHYKDNILLDKYSYLYKINNKEIININLNDIRLIPKEEFKQLLIELNIEFNSI